MDAHFAVWVDVLRWVIGGVGGGHSTPSAFVCIVMTAHSRAVSPHQQRSVLIPQPRSSSSPKKPNESSLHCSLSLCCAANAALTAQDHVGHFRFATVCNVRSLFVTKSWSHITLAKCPAVAQLAEIRLKKIVFNSVQRAANVIMTIIGIMTAFTISMMKPLRQQTQNNGVVGAPGAKSTEQKPNFSVGPAEHSCPRKQTN